MKKKNKKRNRQQIRRHRQRGRKKDFDIEKPRYSLDSLDSIKIPAACFQTKAGPAFVWHVVRSAHCKALLLDPGFLLHFTFGRRQPWLQRTWRSFEREKTEVIVTLSCRASDLASDSSISIPGDERWVEWADFCCTATAWHCPIEI